MSIRILLLAFVSFLSGCSVNSDCAYGVVPQTQPSDPARCRSMTEYNAEKEKLRHSREEAGPNAEKQSWEAQTKDRIEAIDDK